MAHILVVDDEQTICWGLTKLGESLGHRVSTAASAEQALQSVKSLRPDVIMLDVRLPGMDGLSAMAQFRREAGETPIIIMTA